MLMPSSLATPSLPLQLSLEYLSSLCLNISVTKNTLPWTSCWKVLHCTELTFISLYLPPIWPMAAILDRQAQSKLSSRRAEDVETAEEAPWTPLRVKRPAAVRTAPQCVVLLAFQLLMSFENAPLFSSACYHLGWSHHPFLLIPQ